MNGLVEVPEMKRAAEQNFAVIEEEAHDIEADRLPVPGSDEADFEDGSNDFFDFRSPTARDTWLMKLPHMHQVTGDEDGGGFSPKAMTRIRMALFSDGRKKMNLSEK